MRGRWSVHPRTVLLLWAVLPLWWGPLAWWLAYSPWLLLGVIGSFGLTLDLTLVWVLLLAFLTILTAPIALLFRRARRPALRYVAAASIFIPSWIVGECYLGKLVWWDAVSRFERRSAPLVRAITAYQAGRGRPPATLADLVPAYLPKIPS